MNWGRKLKAVNSRLLLNEVTSTVEDLLHGAGVIWASDTHRESFVEMINDYMYSEFLETGKVEQFKVMCDFRNNRMVDMDNGIYFFELQYKQRNCLNMTKVQYTIHDNEPEMELDFTI